MDIKRRRLLNLIKERNCMLSIEEKKEIVKRKLFEKNDMIENYKIDLFADRLIEEKDFSNIEIIEFKEEKEEHSQIKVTILKYTKKRDLIIRKLAYRG